MTKSTRGRWWLSGGLILSGSLLLVLPPDWIERVLGAEPDGGSGELERFVGVVPIIIGLMLAAHTWWVARARRTAAGARTAP